MCKKYGFGVFFLLICKIKKIIVIFYKKMKLSKILIVSATKLEVSKITNQLKAEKKINENLFQYKYKSLDIEVLITGVGAIFTVFELNNILLKNKYDLVLNLGIAGSFNESLNIGDTVNVVSDEFGDIGISDKSNFYTIFEKNFAEANKFPFSQGKLINKNNIFFNDLKKTKAITVCSTSGSAEQINQRKQKFNADIETMEGASFFYVCMKQDVYFQQIRAISNYVKERKFAEWDIGKATSNLAKTIIEFLDKK